MLNISALNRDVSRILGIVLNLFPACQIIRKFIQINISGH
jgi:hypothetical protein